MFCDYKDIKALWIEHLNGSGKVDRLQKGTHNMWKWLNSHNFPDGYIILCANCNKAKYWNNGICPHKQVN